MASFVVKILSVTLGLFFVFIGTLKVTPAVNKELYTEMRKQYIRMAKVFPLVNETGWKPNPHTYRKVVATSEITGGTMLTLLPNSGKLGTFKNVASVYMIVLMINDVIAHSQIKNGLERMSLPIVFSLLLTCRLIIYYQEQSREQKLASESSERKSENKVESTVAQDGSTENKKTR